MAPIRRLAHRLSHRSIHSPVPHLSTSTRRHLHQIQIQNGSDYRTPYHPQAHPLQMVRALLHVTPIELFLIISALCILIAIISWLTWKFLNCSFQFLLEKIGEFDIGGIVKAQVRKAIQQIQIAPKIAARAMKKVGSGAKQLMEGLTRSGEWQETKFGHRNGNGERRGFLEQARQEASTYGYGGQMYTSLRGDRMSDSTGSGMIVVKHREDCNGQCGQTRRSSAEV